MTETGADEETARESESHDSAADDHPTDAAADDIHPTDGDDADSDGDAADDTPDIADLAERDWRAALAATGELTGPITDAIIETHDERGRRAIEAVSELRVKQYRDFTVVVGHHDEHVVEDGGCDCADAAYNLDPENPDDRCWHALAVDIAERVDAVDHHDMWYSEVREFL